MVYTSMTPSKICLRSVFWGTDIEVNTRINGVDSSSWHSIYSHLNESWYDATLRVFTKIAKKHGTTILPIVGTK